MATDKNKHLECVLSSHQIRKEQKLLDKHITKRDEVIQALEGNYVDKLYSPFNSGSYAKNAAVNTKFDFDLVGPFKRNAFDTLEKMYNDVHDFLYETFKEEASIRKQKVSIGMEFFADTDGDVVKIDVVPGRELNLEQYRQDNILNLYVYRQYGKIEKGSDRIRSNVKAQIENIRGQADKDAIRQDIRLLKVWKIGNHKSPKSFFLELITIKAFEKKEISGQLWDRLKAVLEFIRDNVKTISLPDPGNASNNVADTLTDTDKQVLSDDMKFLIERIEADSDNIKLYFTINAKHPCEEKKNTGNKYGVKEGISVPPITRFG